MKVTIDKKNKAVIATGWYKNHKVKAVVVCHPEDTFSEEFGRQLVAKKYKVKKTTVQLNLHVSYMRKLKDLIVWATKELNSETKIVNELDKKILAESYECEKLITPKI